MVCAPVRSTIPSLKLGDYLSVQAHKPCSISHLFTLLIIAGRSACVILFGHSVIFLVVLLASYSHSDEFL